MSTPSPSLSFRSYAELIQKPSYEQMRILHDQKYPRQEPQMFRLPYYAHTLGAIRNYFMNGRNRELLARAKVEARILRPESKRDNNIRVLTAFDSSIQANRALTIRPQRHVSASPGHGVEVRLHFDVTAEENHSPKRILFNCRQVAVTPELARLTLECAGWILEQNGQQARPGEIEYVDLASGTVHTFPRRIRSRTVQMIETTAQAIAALWIAI